MRQFLALTCICLLLSASIMAQPGTRGGSSSYSSSNNSGYNYADERSGFEFGIVFDINPMAEMNHIIDQYNETRPWLADPLPNHNLVWGFEFGWGSGPIDGKWGFDAGHISIRKKTTKTEGVTPGGESFTREVRSRLNEISILGVNYYPIQTGPLTLGVGVNAFDFTWYRVKTQYNDEGWEKINISDIEGAPFVGPFVHMATGSTLHLDAWLNLDNKMKTFLHFQFFYQFFWMMEEELLRVNTALNPSTAYAHNHPTLVRSAGHFGFKTFISF